MSRKAIAGAILSLASAALLLFVLLLVVADTEHARPESALLARLFRLHLVASRLVAFRRANDRRRLRHAASDRRRRRRRRRRIVAHRARLGGAFGHVGVGVAVGVNRTRRGRLRPLAEELREQRRTRLVPAVAVVDADAGTAVAR